MEILVVGMEWFGRTVPGVARALKGMGHQITTFYYHRHRQLSPVWRLAAPSALKDWARPAREAWGGWSVQRMNRRLEQLVRRVRPEMVLILKGETIQARTLAAMRASGARHIAVWWFDDPFLYARAHPTLMDMLCAADRVHVHDAAYVSQLEAAGVAQVSVLPNACDPDAYAFTNSHSAWGMARGANYDIAFVGSVYPERADALNRIRRHRMLVAGPGWSRVLPPRPNLRVIDRVIDAAEYASILSRAHIHINFHRPNCTTTYNSRAFELAAAGAFQLAPARCAASGLLTPGVELESFVSEEELSDRIDDCLRRPEDLRRMGSAARSRVLREHSYIHRMRMVFERASNPVLAES